MADLSPRALCTLSDVKDYAHVDPTDQGNDDTIIRLINAASTAIHNLAGREFKPYSAVAATRVFEVPYADRKTPYSSAHTYEVPYLNAYGWDINQKLRIGDLATLTSTGLNGTVVDASYVTALPRQREEWEPITRIRIATSPASSLNIYTSYTTVEVTGVWGFPLVPEDIRQACVVTVMVWLERDIRTFSETFSIDEQRVVLPRTLPRQVYDAVLTYRDLQLALA